MKHLMILVALFVSSLAMAQMPTFPWNPDGNGDGVIGSSDLIELLTVYGQEFQNAIVSEDGQSAFLEIGQMSYPSCENTCEHLPGSWSLPKSWSDASPILETLSYPPPSYNNQWEPVYEYFDFWMSSDFFDLELNNGYTPNAYVISTFGSEENQPVVRKLMRTILDDHNCYCVIKQLPRVEYSACPDVLFDPSCANQLVSDGWYPIGSVSDSSGNQAFWRFAQ